MLGRRNISILALCLNGTVTDMWLQMDCEATKRNLLERMLLDASVEPTNLPISLLKSITHNFSHDQQIGSGGFAVVYKVSKLYAQLI